MIVNWKLLWKRCYIGKLLVVEDYFYIRFNNNNSLLFKTIQLIEFSDAHILASVNNNIHVLIDKREKKWLFWQRT